MPHVFMMLFLLTLQWSLAGAVLCVAWRFTPQRSGAATRLLAAIPLLTLLSIASLLLADRVLIWNERAMMVVMAGLTGCLWIFGFNRVTSPGGPRMRVFQDPAWVGTVWLSLSILLQGAFALTATWIALNNFLLASPYMIAGWRWMWLTLLAAPLTGALLHASALAGTLPIPALAPLPSPDRSARLTTAFIGAVALRFFALAGSLYLWSVFCPFGSHYFIGRLMDIQLNTMITLRVLLGMILPLLFSLLVLLKTQEASSRQTSIQFMPALILVLMSEMVAAALTAGLGGIAF